jgi:hypothetical protein
MAFPYDALLRTYGALQQVLSADLNAMQQATVDLCYRKTRMFYDLIAPDAAWKFVGASGYLDWVAQATGTSYPAVVPFSFPENVRIYAVKVKVYVASGVGLGVDLHWQDNNIEDNPTVGPSWGTADASDAPTGTGWSVRTLTPSASPHTLGADECGLVLLTDPDVNDEFAAIQVDYEPITAT